MGAAWAHPSVPRWSAYYALRSKVDRCGVTRSFAWLGCLVRDGIILSLARTAQELVVDFETPFTHEYLKRVSETESGIRQIEATCPQTGASRAGLALLRDDLSIRIEDDLLRARSHSIGRGVLGSNHNKRVVALIWSVVIA